MPPTLMSRTPKSTSSGHVGAQCARSKMTFSILIHGFKSSNGELVSSSIAAFGMPISADIDLEGRIIYKLSRCVARRLHAS